MNGKIKSKIYRMDRRFMLKATGLLGVGTQFVSPSKLMAAGECEEISGIPEDVNALAPGSSLQYWVDGIHFEGSTLKSRANISCFLDVKQKVDEFVESVVLTDSSNRVIAAYYYDATTKMSTDHVPFVIFENIELDHTQSYRVFYVVKKGSESLLYLHEIANPARSSMNSHFLPELIRQDFVQFIYEKTPGLLTNPFQFYTHNGIDTHSAKGHILDIGSDGTIKVDMELMHGDSHKDHFMRYFMILDPVGRIVGYVKREWDESAGRATEVTGTKGGAGSMIVEQLSPEQISLLGLKESQIGNVNDATFLRFATEDIFDALAMSVYRLA